jgi:hypothetical protein
MSLSISSGTTPLQGLLTQSQQDLQTLQADLGSGKLDAVQKDFASFRQDALSLFQGSNLNQTGQNLIGSTLSAAATDLQALQTALNAGDLTNAQKAFATFQQDVQNTQNKSHGHHHHRHHHESNGDASNAIANANTNTNINQSANDSLVASLLSAYQAFNNPATAAASTLSITG